MEEINLQLVQPIGCDTQSTVYQVIMIKGEEQKERITIID